MAPLKHHLSKALTSRKHRQDSHLAATKRSHELERARRETREAAAAAGTMPAAATTQPTTGGTT